MARAWRLYQVTEPVISPRERPPQDRPVMGSLWVRRSAPLDSEGRSRSQFGEPMVSRVGVVVVTGATGRQGGAVARHLLSDDWPVRVVTRRPDGSAARALAALGADVVRADMMNAGE